LPSQGIERRRPTDGTRLVEAGFAAQQALGGLKEYDLAERENWARALEGTQPAEPVLVQRLDRLDSYYWIVPLARAGQQVPAAVSVDARFGDYQQAIALPRAEANAFINLSERDVLDQVVEQRFELPADAGRLLVRPEALCVYPTLVWRPCRESLSPFYPFRLVTVGAHHLYIRIDGPVFTSLTLGQHGI
jgi:hypothetical protein